jgi:hypothetical protein
MGRPGSYDGPPEVAPPPLVPKSSIRSSSEKSKVMVWSSLPGFSSGPLLVRLKALPLWRER